LFLPIDFAIRAKSFTDFSAHRFYTPASMFFSFVEDAAPRIEGESPQ
jgi:hypothetical protein